MNVTYYSEDKSPEISYLFDFLFLSAGFKARRLEQYDQEQIDVYYGPNPEQVKARLKIKANPRPFDKLQPGDVIAKNILEDIPRTRAGSLIDFDIIKAIGYFLFDYANDGIEAYDEHDRLQAVKSFQARHDILMLPLVNLYVLYFREILENITGQKGVPLWPEGKTCAVILSHDVDAPDRKCFKNDMLFRNELLKEHLKQGSRIKALKAGLGMAQYALKYPFIKQNYWLFREIMDTESELDMKSTFFFAVINAGEPAANIKADVNYDIEKKKFIPVFTQMKERGFEIGLHAGYNALQNADNFKREKAKLERLAGAEIHGIRHHYWHVGRDVESTLEKHQEAGFKYDSSVGFNDRMGFRRSVALPYYPWMRKNRKPLELLEMPTFLMDGNIFYQDISLEKGLELMKKQIGLIKKCQGVGSVIWHVRTSLPKSPEFITYGSAYLALLQYLAENTDIWVTNMAEIRNFFINRREKIDKL